MFKEDFNVSWTQQGTVKGLLRGIISGTTLDEHTAVALELDGVRAAATSLVSDAVLDAIYVNIHTHLIPNGRHVIALRLEIDGHSVRSAPSVVEVSNDGSLAVAVEKSMRDNGTPLVFLGQCDSSAYDYSDVALTPWHEREPAQVEEHIRGLQDAGVVNDLEADALRSFSKNGFMVLEGLIPDAAVDQANRDMDEAIDSKYQGYKYGQSTRLEQMHVTFPGIRDIWLNKDVHRLLGAIFGTPSEPCQSLVYVFGSQQDAHQDTIHLTPFPAGYMCGVWVALEDVRDNSGELVVYPGSHRLPRVYLKDEECAKVGGDWSEFGQKVVGRWSKMISDAGLERSVYKAKRGSVLIWHENLMHAGSVRIDKSLSRRSMVSHCFAQGSVVYYDSTGLVGSSTSLSSI